MMSETAIFLYLFAFAANVASQAQVTYPHIDEDGYYLAYKVSKLHAATCQETTNQVARKPVAFRYQHIILINLRPL